jgi:hypothetical protein
MYPKFKLSKCLHDFIPILLIVFFVFFPSRVIPFSHTTLGRFLAIMLIVYYAKKDITIGLFVCILTILYYQQDHFEYILNVSEGFLWEMTLDDGKYPIYNNDNYTPYKYEVYHAFNTKLRNESSLERKFQRENCVNGELQSKGVNINPEMSEHVYPELKFDNAPCNPCNPMCKFSIIENKIRVEEELLKPKNSNEWFDTILSRMQVL